MARLTKAEMAEKMELFARRNLELVEKLDTQLRRAATFERELTEVREQRDRLMDAVEELDLAEYDYEKHLRQYQDAWGNVMRVFEKASRRRFAERRENGGD